MLCVYAGDVLAGSASELLWLTESAPARAKGSSGQHEHGEEARGSYTEVESMDTTHAGAKHLWLRQGDDPKTAEFVESGSAPATLSLIDGNGQLHDLALSEQNGLYHVKADLPELGFYNAYLIQQAVKDKVLEVNVAKAELLKGTCCIKNANDELTKTSINAAAPLELVRTHLPDEGLFTRLASGDKLNFKVLSNGNPQPGAAVTMITQQGWRKTSVSDAMGNVEFTLIRDYFPSWENFQRRHKETYLVVAERELSSAGEFNGGKYISSRYRTTLSGNYYPSAQDYRSYAIGLGVGLFVVSFGGLGIYLYRRRRARPYREVRFDGVY